MFQLTLCAVGDHYITIKELKHVMEKLGFKPTAGELKSFMDEADHDRESGIMKACTPPFEKSPISTHRFCVLPPLKNDPTQPIGFVYSPLWKITHQKPSVLCTPPFEKWPIKSHWFCELPPLKNDPTQPIGFVYSPLWKITVFGGSLLSGWAFISANTVYGTCLWKTFSDNGKIDFSEFLAVMKTKMHDMMRLEELEKAFRVFDYNGKTASFTLADSKCKESLRHHKSTILIHCSLNNKNNHH